MFYPLGVFYKNKLYVPPEIIQHILSYLLPYFSWENLYVLQTFLKIVMPETWVPLWKHCLTSLDSPLDSLYLDMSYAKGLLGRLYAPYCVLKYRWFCVAINDCEDPPHGLTKERVQQLRQAYELLPEQPLVVYYGRPGIRYIAKSPKFPNPRIYYDCVHGDDPELDALMTI